MINYSAACRRVSCGKFVSKQVFIPAANCGVFNLLKIKAKGLFTVYCHPEASAEGSLVNVSL